MIKMTFHSKMKFSFLKMSLLFIKENIRKYTGNFFKILKRVFLMDLITSMLVLMMMRLFQRVGEVIQSFGRKMTSEVMVKLVRRLMYMRRKWRRNMLMMNH